MCTHQQCMRALVGNMSYKHLLLHGLPLILLVMSSDETEVLSFMPNLTILPLIFSAFCALLKKFSP